MTSLYITVGLGDYVSLFETLTFMVSPDSRVVQITVEDDDRVEDTESFGVLLDSSDPAVLLPRPFSPITLLDSSGTGCEHQLYSIICRFYQNISHGES